jgi:uncharacterized protein
MEFINREKDIKYLRAHFESEPNSLLFVYGPKSSGKSTLLEKVARELNSQTYAVNFLDLRQVIIYNFKTFLNIFFPKNIRNKAKDILSGFTINAGFFSLKMEEESILEENAFKIIVDKLISANKRGIKPVIIIDELQLLKHIYINGERYLIDELFNLFIALTKVRHIAHVVLATSDSYFIEEIYKSSKLAKTSDFFFLDHFDKKTVSNWLKKENFSEKEINKVWDFVGGCPWEIRQIIEKKKQGIDVENSINMLLKNSYGRVFEFGITLIKEEKDVFDKVIKEIAEKGFFEVHYDNQINYLDVLLKKTIELDIWFYKPEEHKIEANSISVFHSLKKLINS